MSATLFRTSTALRAGLRARAAAPMAGMATTFVRGKATLPDLSCKTRSLARQLEPNLTFCLYQTTTVLSNPKFPARSWSFTTPSTTRPTSTATTLPLRLLATLRPRATPRLPLLRLPFSTSTAVVTSTTPSSGRTLPPTARAEAASPRASFWYVAPGIYDARRKLTILQTAINEDFGSFDNLKKQTNAALAGIQGSGWAWLVKDKTSGTLGVVTRANQDPITGNLVPLMGIDAWEHAYYLQYQNRKVEYFGAIWDVINWGTVSKRFEN